MVYKIHNPESDLQVRRGIGADKIRHLEDAVEILKEQIESLKLELCHKNHELEEIKQELSSTNHELCNVLELYTASSN